MLGFAMFSKLAFANIMKLVVFLADFAIRDNDILRMIEHYFNIFWVRDVSQLNLIWT